ncbi:hypothetical protein [Phocoenobacter skyensis]|uniref:Uncharacterized protein n=1 Tax=Phocoenobacter skyensis TaxID=97481 RepID=A0ABT9JKI3_9PAST|nr:hypothetical protein [Pasteurella skyensis]MDP8078340.1 hypothetical protein [Pasteurella skyensis]MDP8084568.1 hypothetical protein [Pasteurella skyensis]
MIDKLDFLCSAVSSMSEEEKKQALAYAEKKRPESVNISDDDKDDAVIYYAGYLLSKQQADKVVPTGVVSETEGDLSRKYGDNGLSDDPCGYLKRYKSIVGKCKEFGITAFLQRC